MISLTRKLIVLALSIVTSIALAYSLFGLGFMVCTVTYNLLRTLTAA